VRSLLEWHAAALADRCALAVSLVPEDILHDRAALTVCLMEEIRLLSESKIVYLERGFPQFWSTNDNHFIIVLIEGFLLWKLSTI
jgi:hypothetical protein